MKTKTKFAPMYIRDLFVTAQPATTSVKEEVYDDAASKARDKLWAHYFGFDGTCLEHDLLSCGICRRFATGRCISGHEEYRR